jgi:rare lipoprotein A
MQKIGLLVITLLSLCCFVLTGCSVITAPYRVTKKAVKGTVYVVQGAYNFTAGTTNLLYKVGKFTFKVVKAPLDWPLVNRDIETIDGLPPKEAIREGRVTTASYTVKGKTYHPMSVKEAANYDETGIASWYGYETVRQHHGAMTANGEAFDPNGLTAAHKYLPLPTHVKVTNLENQRWIIVRVNDRGPFPSDYNPKSGDRIIDVSAGAAKKLGFYGKGTARVRVETIELKEGQV